MALVGMQPMVGGRGYAARGLINGFDDMDEYDDDNIPVKGVYSAELPQCQLIINARADQGRYARCVRVRNPTYPVGTAESFAVRPREVALTSRVFTPASAGRVNKGGPLIYSNMGGRKAGDEFPVVLGVTVSVYDPQKGTDNIGVHTFGTISIPCVSQHQLPPWRRLIVGEPATVMRGDGTLAPVHTYERGEAKGVPSGKFLPALRPFSMMDVQSTFAEVGNALNAEHRRITGDAAIDVAQPLPALTNEQREQLTAFADRLWRQHSLHTGMIGQPPLDPTMPLDNMTDRQILEAKCPMRKYVYFLLESLGVPNNVWYHEYDNINTPTQVDRAITGLDATEPPLKRLRRGGLQIQPNRNPMQAAGAVMGYGVMYALQYAAQLQERTLGLSLKPAKAGGVLDVFVTGPTAMM